MNSIRGAITLELTPTLQGTTQLRDGFSDVVQSGEQLWLASNETTSLERLTHDEEGLRFRSHTSLLLAELLWSSRVINQARLQRQQGAN